MSKSAVHRHTRSLKKRAKALRSTKRLREGSPREICPQNKQGIPQRKPAINGSSGSVAKTKNLPAPLKCTAEVFELTLIVAASLHRLLGWLSSSFDFAAAFGPIRMDLDSLERVRRVISSKSTITSRKFYGVNTAF